MASKIKQIGELEDIFDSENIFNDIHNGKDAPSINDEDDDDEDEEPKDWTLVRALDKVLDNAHMSCLKKSFFRKSAAPLEYLRTQLNMTDIQVIVIAMLIDSGRALSWKSMGQFLNISRLSMMVYTDDIEQLVNRGWVCKRSVYEIGNTYDGYALEKGVVTAIRKNQPFKPTTIDNLSMQEYVDLVSSRIIHTMRHRHSENFQDLEPWLTRITEANLHLELCSFINGIQGNEHDMATLLLVMADYVYWGNSESEGLDIEEIEKAYDDNSLGFLIRSSLEDGENVLFRCNAIEHKCENGMADNTTLTLTKDFKEKYLAGYKPKVHKKQGGSKSLTSHSKIVSKEMFYNKNEDTQLQQLTSMLCEEQLSKIQERLENMGMRKGFACLFYGAPGTGKTESVLQIARQTKRDIMQVDISAMRDKYVGESEKNIKGVFTHYRQACEDAAGNGLPIPILFLNEADAIISKRTENVERSVEKMDNAMQNIILQELENLDGILIATTNLTSNLDKAFERRFIYKVEFRKPETDVKAKIWKSMLKHISNEDAKALADRYDLSGGQIENISRKSVVEYILTGNNASLDKLNEFCKAEIIDSKQQRQHIAGFAA